MGVPSDGSYGVPVVDLRFPLHVRERQVSIVEARLGRVLRGKIDASVAELSDERDTVKGRVDLAKKRARHPCRAS